DLDVHVAEHRDDLVELLGRRAVGGDLALVARLGGGRRRPRRAGPGRLRLLLFDWLLLALHASPPRGEPGCGARVDGLRQGLSRCWGMGLPGVRIVPSDGIRPPGGTGPQQGNVVAVPDGVKGNFRPPPGQVPRPRLALPAEAGGARLAAAAPPCPAELIPSADTGLYARRA